MITLIKTHFIQNLINMEEKDNIFRDAAIINGICRNISARSSELTIKLSQESFNKILEQLKKNDPIKNVTPWGIEESLYTKNPKFRLFGVEFNFKIV